MPFRRIIFWIHLIVGAVAGLFIVVMALTGAILAFEDQAIDLAEHSLKTVARNSTLAPLTLDEMYTKVQASLPGDTIRSITLEHNPKASVLFEHGDQAFYVNPCTGAVVGPVSALRDFFEFIEGIHRWFGFKGALKKNAALVKGIANILFLFMLISGLYLWWPSKIVAMKSKFKGKAKTWNKHNVVGFWSAPILMVISLTGIIMSFSWASGFLYTITRTSPPVRATESSAQSTVDVHMSLASVVGQAENLMPRWTSMDIQLKANALVNVNMKGESSTYKMSRLVIDRRSGNIIKWEPYQKQNKGLKLNILAQHLHTGEALGILGQLLAFIASIGAIVLVWTGFSLLIVRYSKKH